MRILLVAAFKLKPEMISRSNSGGAAAERGPRDDVNTSFLFDPWAGHTRASHPFSPTTHSVLKPLLRISRVPAEVTIPKDISVTPSQPECQGISVYWQVSHVSADSDV
jgi:hypothetical protein